MIDWSTLEKDEKEWTTVEKNAYFVNYKALNVIVCVVS